jgi:hypothetical protein
MYPELAKVVSQGDLEEAVGRHRLLTSGLAGLSVCWVNFTNLFMLHLFCLCISR